MTLKTIVRRLRHSSATENADLHEYGDKNRAGGAFVLDPRKACHRQPDEGNSGADDDLGHDQADEQSAADICERMLIDSSDS